MFWLVVAAAWVVGAELGVFTKVGQRLPSRVPGIAVWTIVAASVAFLAVTGRREIIRGRRTDHLINQLRDALGSFGMLTEPSLGALPLDALLQQLLGRLCTVLDTEIGVIFVTDDGLEYTIRAAHGLELGTGLIGRWRPARPGDGLDGWVNARRVISDASRLGPLSRALGFPLASAACCPVVVEGRLLGACAVGASGPGDFDERRMQLLQLVADRAGVDIERARLGEAQERSQAEAAQSQRHDAMLAHASEVLLGAKDDYQANLTALVGVVVPEFADRCVIDVPPGPAPVPAGERAIVIPVAIGDLVFGTLMAERDTTRPPFDPRDAAAALDLAGRIAVALERVLRYREARDAAESSRRLAGQLDQLIRASIDVQQLRDESEVLARMAEGARLVLGAETAVASAGGHAGAPLEAVAHLDRETVLRRPTEAGPRPIDAGGADGRARDWLETTFAGASQGRLAVHRAPDPAYTPDDETVLALLAQMAFTALDNTRLYHSTRDSEARWRVLVETAPISIVEIDLAGTVLWWNRAATDLFDWPETRIMPARRDPAEAGSPGTGSTGTGWEAPSFAAETAAGLRRLWSEVVGGGDVVDRELTGTDVGGELRDLAVSAAPLRSTEGAIDAILLLVADVTDRHRLEDELHRAQRMEAIGQLAGGVAHDFNNLLTLITGYVDLMRHHLDADERSQELVASVQTAITRASLLTGQLLTISRRRAARPVVVAPVDALRSVAEVLDRILGTGIELRWVFDPDAGRVRIDPGELEQVILNLAINARDAMPGGGRLDITVFPTRLDARQSADLGLPPGPYVRLSVTDSGTGMTPETLRRCFEPLFTTKGPSGTGLGLAAVKGVVTESGGDVHARSVEGGGTAFIVHLPAAADVAGLPEPTPGPPRRLPSPARTVLVAGEDVMLRRLMRRVLSRRGYEVLEAGGPTEALEWAADWPGVIDAVICEVTGSDDGPADLVAALVAGRPSILVLLVADAGPDPGTAPPDLRSERTVPPAVLTKPFKPSQLLECVEDLFAHRDPPELYPEIVRVGSRRAR